MHGIVQEIAALILAQTEGGGGSQNCQEAYSSLLPLVAMVAIFYFVMISPARKERKEHQTMLDALKRGDEVIMQSGMLGTITDITDPFLTLEIAKNVKVRVLRSSIAKKHVEAKKPEEKEKPAKA